MVFLGSGGEHSCPGFSWTLSLFLVPAQRQDTAVMVSPLGDLSEAGTTVVWFFFLLRCAFEMVSLGFRGCFGGSEVIVLARAFHYPLLLKIIF
jgi:hypothetical protein